MAGTLYSVSTDKAAIRKTASASGDTVTTVTKGTKVYITSSSGGWSQLTKDHAKINNKNVAGYYIATSKISKMNTKTSSNSSNHTAHSTKTLNGKTVTDAWIYTNCDGKKGGTKAFKKGETVKITKYCITNGMYYISGAMTISNGKQSGWVAASSVQLTNKSANKELKVLTAAQKKLSGAAAKAKAKAKQNSKKQANAAAKQLGDIKVTSISGSAYAEKLLVKNCQGIHGMPYQFMPSVDLRLSNKVSFGRKYVERIVSKMPLLLFTPGKPDFMTSFTKQDRKNIISTLVNTLNGGDKLSSNELNKLVKNAGKYYTFKFAYADYYKYVNQMLRYCAIILGIGNVKHGSVGYVKSLNGSKWGETGSAGNTGKFSTSLESFSWQKMVNSNLKGFINATEYVAFYIDSDTSISESFDNSTTTSSIGSAINSAASMSSEINFLAGSMAGVRLAAMDSEEFQSSYKKVTEIANEHLNGSRLFTKLGEIFQTIAKGGRILFPEIWEDSSFTKSYSLSIKLRTPDADKISWFLNICVPLIHLLALAAPHELGPNGYCSPFLVRAYYKGIMNCDMGIITSMDISKGKEGAWSIDGLPTEVDVNITLKDLYGFLTISKKSGYKFFENSTLIDYLCNTCGVNINKMEIARVVEAYSAFTLNKYKDILPYAWLGLQEGASNIAGQLYAKVVKNDY